MVPIRVLVRGRQDAQRDEDILRAFTMLLLIATAGCSVLADKRTVAGCQLADGYTTKRALDRGAVEANPILSGASGDAIMAIKALFAAVLLWAMPGTEDMDKGEKFLYGALSVVGCGAALHNNQVQR